MLDFVTFVCTMLFNLIVLIGGTSALPQSDLSSQSPAQQPLPSGNYSGKYTSLVWEDNFDGGYGQPDLTGKWNADDSCFGMWANQEWECYTSKQDNVLLDGYGNLVLSFKQLNYSRGGYTSGKLTSRQNWLYGRFEARIKVPKGQGVWPAFWMLPQDNKYGIWPFSGEIDIMEILGHKPRQLHGTIHYSDADGHGSSSKSIEAADDLSSDFHIYAVEWDADEIRWYLDGAFYNKVSSSDTQYFQNPPSDGSLWPFNQPFNIILNLAVGGNWPGDPDPALTHGELVVDYVRVFQ
ncbi:hypothetical protein MIR68_007595 [Amoeboaphelidium protococcarum]|nr:hypothetical protein MIR68_007595 [Amoeboaphelidium protococcarum]KAI3645543.1 hypothetical protein MP228_008471 [Amoeboaphelidium protococcarum]